MNEETIKANQPFLEQLAKHNKIVAEINLLLDGLTTGEISSILSTIDRCTRRKSIYKPSLPDGPIIHGERCE